MWSAREMSEGSISRRTLLLAGAGALAGAVVRPPRTLASPGGAHGSRLEAIEVGDLGKTGRTLELPAGVDLVGLQWAGSAAARPQLRVRLADRRWGPWASAGAHGHGPEARAAGPPTGEPLWTGGSRELELRASPPIAAARLHLIFGDVVSPRSAQAAALPLAVPLLAAGPGQPPIIARQAWAKGVQLPRVAPEYGAVELGFVHHTENPNGYSASEVPAMLRAIFEFHRNVNGWNDIGYNFVVDLYGRIFEARAGGIDEPVVGAHAGGYNLVSSGVAVLGSFSGTPISSAARAALQRLLAWKLSLHGTPSVGRVTVRVNPAGAIYSKYPANARVSLPRVAGHRDGDSTECPGDVLYGELPGIRGQIRRLAGDPTLATLALAPAVPPPVEPAPPTTPTSGGPAQLLVTLRTLSGTALAGAPILIQARTVSRRGLLVSESTVAEGVTDAQGQLVLPASFASGAPKTLNVRALYVGGAGHGAAVSPAVPVPPQPVLTPPAGTVPSS
jgi:N-acetylmuramoyl-L-alanine amidase